MATALLIKRTKHRSLAAAVALIFISSAFLSLIMMHADPTLKMGLGLMPKGGCAMAFMNNLPCLMSINDHLEMWQTTFTAIFTGTIFWGVMVAAAYLAARRLRYLLYAPRRAVTKQNYQNQNPLDKIFSYLEQLFSSGILHTRVYA